MKLLFAAIALAAFGLAGLPAEAKGKKPLTPLNQDRGMTALPYSLIPESPTVRWNGRSPVREPADDNQFPNESANGN